MVDSDGITEMKASMESRREGDGQIGMSMALSCRDFPYDSSISQPLGHGRAVDPQPETIGDYSGFYYRNPRNAHGTKMYEGVMSTVKPSAFFKGNQA